MQSSSSINTFSSAESKHAARVSEWVHLVDLVEHTDVVAELERRTKDDNKRREDEVNIQTLQPVIIIIIARLPLIIIVIINCLY